MGKLARSLSWEVLSRNRERLAYVRWFFAQRLQPLSRPFRHRNYCLYFAGQGISLVGTWLTRTATGWLVYRLSNSVWLLGLVGFSGQILTFLLTPLSGVLIDRWDRRRTLVITQLLAMGQSMILAVLSLSGAITVWHIVFLNAWWDPR